MAELKTQKNAADVGKFIAGIKDDQQRADCEALLELMQKLTGEPPVMWGKAMVGFAHFGIAARPQGRLVSLFSKQNVSLYLHCILENQTALLEKLNKTGNSSGRRAFAD